MISIKERLEFSEGDDVVLAEGIDQGSVGTFLRLREDVKRADIKERTGRIRSSPVAWLTLLRTRCGAGNSQVRLYSSGSSLRRSSELAGTIDRIGIDEMATTIETHAREFVGRNGAASRSPGASETIGRCGPASCT